MFVAYLVVAGITVALTVAAGVADLMKAEFVLGNATTLGLDLRWLPALAWLKLAGAAGIVAGPAVPALGLAAATGLVLFFTGAVIAHVRAGIWRTMGYPAMFLALAAGTLALTAAAL